MTIPPSQAMATSGGHGPLTVAYIPVERLKPDPQNARMHPKKQIRQIAGSIESFGFNVPILIDGGFAVIAGHGRLQAARQLGWAEVPTILLDHLTETQRRAFMIADNRLTEIALWDDGLLAKQLKELSEVELSFEIEATGFDMAEIDLRVETLTLDEKGAPEPTIPVVEGAPVTVAGDLWLLGHHRILCGSALEATTAEALMGSEKAGVVFSDPPYNVPIEGNVSGLGRVHHREFAMAAGEMDADAFTRFLSEALGRMSNASRHGALFYICMDWRHIAELLAAAKASALGLINLCVWTKPNAGMGSLYRSQHELVFVLKSGRGQHQNNVQLGRFGRNRTNVWPYAVGPGFGRAGEEGRLADLHPTVKPVPLVVDAILDSSRRGDIVLDPFLGSGTTLMAAERTGRKRLAIPCRLEWFD